MDNKEFGAKLDKIFRLNESVTVSVKPVDPTEVFRNAINSRLRGLVQNDQQPHGQVGPANPPGVAFMEEPKVLDERNNPISVSTIKDQVINFGPQGVSQIVNKLSADMNKTNSDGQPTSDFNMFIDSIKQDGLELLVKYGADAGGVKVPPGGSAATPTTAPDKKEPGQELASL